MNQKVRRRAMRNILAAFLQSDLSEHEIRQLADDLSFGSLGREIGDYIREALLTLRNDRYSNDQRYERNPVLLTEIQEIISRRRLPKKILQQLMLSASPKLKLNELPSDFTVAELVQKYLESATSADVAAFINILKGEPADAYLKGISRRGR